MKFGDLNRNLTELREGHFSLQDQQAQGPGEESARPVSGKRMAAAGAAQGRETVVGNEVTVIAMKGENGLQLR